LFSLNPKRFFPFNLPTLPPQRSRDRLYSFQHFFAAAAVTRESQCFISKGLLLFSLRIDVSSGIVVDFGSSLWARLGLLPSRPGPPSCSLRVSQKAVVPLLSCWQIFSRALFGSSIPRGAGPPPPIAALNRTFLPTPPYLGIEKSGPKRSWIYGPPLSGAMSVSAPAPFSIVPS